MGVCGATCEVAGKEPTRIKNTAPAEVKDRCQVTKSMSRTDEILAVATQLFYERGYGQVSVDEIGVAAGLSGPAIYRYFPGKAQLLAALCDEGLDMLLRSTAQTATDKPEDDLLALITSYVRFQIDHFRMSHVSIHEVRALAPSDFARLQRRWKNYLKVWVEAVQRVHPELTLTQTETAAMAVIGMLNSLTTFIPSFGKDMPGHNEIATVYSVFALKGLAGLAEDLGARKPRRARRT